MTYKRTGDDTAVESWLSNRAMSSDFEDRPGFLLLKHNDKRILA